MGFCGGSEERNRQRSAGEGRSTASCTGTTTSCPKCQYNDYEKDISISSSYGRYCRKYKPDGTEYSTSELPMLKLRAKIYVPMKTGGKITVEIKFKTDPQTGVTTTNVNTAKNRMENGINTHWNGKFTLEINDPECEKKSFSIKYSIVWVTSKQHYVLKIHSSYPREGENRGIVDVQNSTSEWIYAHEFGHCIGLPDEYALSSGTETVRYIKPDGTLDTAISAPPNGKSKTASDATIMAAYDNTVTLKRHAWNIAIEVQELLRAELGRAIECTIK